MTGNQRARRVTRRELGPVASLIVAVALNASSVPPASGQDAAAISENIAANIERSQRELNALQDDIGDQRAALAAQLNEAERAVAELREQTIAIRRLADEQTLGLDRLESRVDALREQSRFEADLVAGFADRASPRNADNPVGGSALADDVRKLERYVAETRAALQPRWRSADLVMPDGRIEAVDSLRLGPVRWFWQPDTGRGGLVDDEGDLEQAELLFSSASEIDAMRRLYESGRGALTFDPTLSEALLLAEDDDTIVEHVRKGGIWVIPILLFALFASAIAVAKAVGLWKLPPIMPALAAQAEKSLRDSGDLEALRSRLGGAQAELFDLSLAARTPQQRDDTLFACLLDQKHRLERWLGAIAVTASVAPLLGLLGTVSGMITTFKLLTLFGAGDPSSVSVGISEALVTTELGLIVAIPALLAHAIMTRKVRSYFSQLETSAVELSQLPIREPEP